MKRKPRAGQNLLDALTEDEYQALKADIAKRGLVTPIVVEKASGLVVDGAHRLRACRELGIEPKVVEREFSSAAARDEEAMLLNLIRRQLGGPASWGKAFAKLLEIRGVERGKPGRPAADQQRVTLAAVARELGVPERTARWRLRVWEELAAHPDLAGEVDAGQLPAGEALRAAAVRQARSQPPLRAARRVAPPPAPQAEPRSERPGDPFQVLDGDCLEVMADLPPDTYASLLTDPPSGAEAAGAEWDTARGGREDWIAWLTARAQQMLRLLKPGAHGFVWALPRTSHWTARAFEDAGFEIIDVFTHHFAQGMPKAADVGRAVARIEPAARGRWDGWRAGVAPASEHWLAVRKPLAARNIAENLLDHGAGALNIDASRIGDRWPRNVVFSHAEDCRLIGTREVPANSHWPAERVSAYGRHGAVAAADPAAVDRVRKSEQIEQWECIPGCPVALLDANTRFAWVAKPARAERVAGLPESVLTRVSPHEAMKPVSLLRHLLLMTTPPGGRILDPFAGLASVGCAAASLGHGYRYTGIEERGDYAGLARARLAHWRNTAAAA